MNPFKKFKLWFDLAKKKYPFDHTAFALASSYNNQPHVRMVLLKLILDDGFVFFTNISSNKGKHFKKNPKLSMCFYWEELNKQIRIVGKGSIVNSSISDKYFSTRPRKSQIGAWVSNQSSEISSSSELSKKEELFTKKFQGFKVPRPDYWVGIKISPTEFEFWQQGEYRLHKIEAYKLKKKIWERKLLSP